MKISMWREPYDDIESKIYKARKSINNYFFRKEDK